MCQRSSLYCESSASPGSLHLTAESLPTSFWGHQASELDAPPVSPPPGPTSTNLKGGWAWSTSILAMQFRASDRSPLNNNPGLVLLGAVPLERNQAPEPLGHLFRQCGVPFPLVANFLLWLRSLRKQAPCEVQGGRRTWRKPVDLRWSGPGFRPCRPAPHKLHRNRNRDASER